MSEKQLEVLAKAVMAMLKEDYPGEGKVSSVVKVLMAMPTRKTTDELNKLVRKVAGE